MITLTYIHHNCFVFDAGERTFLFDYPGPDHATDVAFTDADKRLRSQCGAEQFVRSIQPKVVVPMHTFGHLEWVVELRLPSQKSGSKLFGYTHIGHSEVFDI